jgi:hypothetical protein
MDKYGITLPKLEVLKNVVRKHFEMEMNKIIIKY